MEIENINLNHKSIREIGKYKIEVDNKINMSVLKKLFFKMIEIRLIEEKLIEEYHPADEMRCPVHFCIGQEAVPSSLTLLLEKKDYLFSHHRSHGYYLGKGCPSKNLFAELYGKKDGSNLGRAGSQDISYPSKNFFSGAIITGSISIATGVAFGIKQQKLGAITLVGFGEGATDEGAFWESIAYAVKENLPIIYVIENNKYATFSDQLKRQEKDNITEKVRAFGMRSKKIFGNDIIEVYQSLFDEIKNVKNQKGPALIESYTYRINSHVGPGDDNFYNSYRDQDEIEFWKENCPIKICQEYLISKGVITKEIIDDWKKKILTTINENINYSKRNEFPIIKDWYSANINDEVFDKNIKFIDDYKRRYNASQHETKIKSY